MIEELEEEWGGDSPTGFVSKIQWQVRRQRKVASVVPHGRPIRAAPPPCLTSSAP